MQISNRKILLVFVMLIVVGGFTAILATTGLQSRTGTSVSKLADTIATQEFVPDPLDGMTFIGALGPDGKPTDVNDVFVFENGTFVSKECELRCENPARS